MTDASPPPASGPDQYARGLQPPRSHDAADRGHPAPPPVEKGQSGQTSSDTRGGVWRPARNAWITIVIFAVVIIAGVLLILAAWRLPPFATTVQVTDDAYVSGRSTVISPEVSGYVWQVSVDDFAHVRRGEVLVTIDPRTYQQQVEQANADLSVRVTNLDNNRQTLARARADVAEQDAAVANARAQLTKALADAERSSDLVRDGSVSARENDQNIATSHQAQAGVAQAVAARDSALEQVRSVQVNNAALAAQVRQARAALGAARLQLEHTVIRAPVDGQLSEVGVHAGQYVAAGAQLFFLVPPEIWVTANYKEAETRHMAVGQPATLTVDALGETRIRGHVDRLAPATGSQFAVLKPNNATGNFIKVPQRIGVRILVDAGQPLAGRLRPGLSVEARVDTAGGPPAR